MNPKNEFHTLKGYQLIEDWQLTPAMEDYLEMICRIIPQSNQVRVVELSKMLHVRPPSVSKMIKELCSLGYINAERYGDITLTEKGKAAGSYLLYRHNVIHDFLCYINQTQNELEEAEKIEHFLSQVTVKNIDRFLNGQR